MISEFCLSAGLPNINDDSSHQVNGCMFSLAKLMSSVFLADNDDDDNDDKSNNATLCEIDIAISMRHQLSNAVIEQIQELSYVLK
jgi:hypothetical protein